MKAAREAVGLLAGTWLSGNALPVIVVVAVGLLALVALLFSMLLMSRRKYSRETREIVSSLEGIRSGHEVDRMTVDPGSPLSLVSDAVNRLGQDLGARLRSAEAARDRLRAVADAARDSAVITTDLDGDVQSFNATAVKIYGWPEEEMLNRPVSLLFEEEAYKDFLPKLARRSLRESGIETRTLQQRRDGSQFPAEVYVSLARDSEGRSTGFLMSVRDVAEQVHIESRLRESEQRYRRLVDNLADGVLIVRGGKLLYVNDSFARISGLSTDQLISSALRDRVATRDVLLVEEQLAAVESGEQTEAALCCVLLDAKAAPVTSVRLSASAIEYGGAPAVLILVRDETDSRRLEAELRRNEARLDAVLEATQEGILVVLDDREGGRVQMTNRAFAERFDLRSDQVLGATLSELSTTLRELGEWSAPLTAFLDNRHGAESREVITLSDGRQGDLEITAAPLVTRAGRTIGRVLACRDQTEERESQRKLQLHAEELQLAKVKLEQSHRKLDALNRDLKTRSEQLDRVNHELRTLDEMKSNLLGNVSHELQTPLVSIRGYTEMTLKERLGPINDEQRKGLSLCLKNIDRLISMIDNLMVFSRSESELGQLKLTHFELRPVIDEVSELLRTKLQSRRITLTVDIEGEEPRIHGDRDRIQQVFINLLSNAIKFNRDEGTISIGVKSSKPGFTMVHVADSGIGIPSDQLDRIFDRHYQVQGDPARSPEGSGIGLAIVRDVLRLHGCRIAVESERGRGSRFRFSLPLSEERPGAPAPRPVEAPDEAADVPPAAAVVPPSRPISIPEPSTGESANGQPGPQAAPAERPEAAPWDESPPSEDAVEPPRPRFRIIRRKG